MWVRSMLARAGAVAHASLRRPQVAGPLLATAGTSTALWLGNTAWASHHHHHPGHQQNQSSSGPAAGGHSSGFSSRAAAASAWAPPLVAPDTHVRVALCQMAVGADKAQNLAAARDFIRRAAEQGAQLVVLPEMFNCPYSNTSFPLYAEPIPGSGAAVDPELHPSTHALLEVAREHGVWLVGGSIPEAGPQGELYNTCVVVDGPRGQVAARHRKLHLFDIDIPGGIRFQESETLTPGDSLTLVDTPWGRIGVAICYDVRFAEMAQACAAAGAVLMVYPGAFNMTTGPLHWELLQRARALDNQMFVATCSPARDLNASYHAWGHSTVVGPMGDVRATTEHEPDIVLCDLDLDVVRRTRQNIPVLRQKRPDVYPSAFQRGQAPKVFEEAESVAGSAA